MRVKAKDELTESDYSLVRSFRINTPPPVPSLLSVADGARVVNAPDSLVFRAGASDADSDTLWFEVTLSRNAGFSPVAHVIRSRTDPARFSRSFSLSGFDNISLYFNGLNLEKGTWFWRVKTYDKTDYSAASATRTFVVNTPSISPSLVSPLADAVLLGGPDVLRFTCPVDADGDSLSFSVELDSVPNFNDGAIYTYNSWVNAAPFGGRARYVAGEEITFTCPGSMVLNEGNWYWRIRGNDGYEMGYPSSARLFRVDNRGPKAEIEYPSDNTVFATTDPVVIYGRAMFSAGISDSVLISVNGGGSSQCSDSIRGSKRIWSYSFTPPGEGNFTILRAQSLRLLGLHSRTLSRNKQYKARY